MKAPYTKLENLMKNPVTTIKQSVHNNPGRYIAASAVVGVVTTIVLTRKLQKPEEYLEAIAVDKWIDKLNATEHTVYIMPEMVAEKFQQFLDAK